MPTLTAPRENEAVQELGIGDAFRLHHVNVDFLQVAVGHRAGAFLLLGRRSGLRFRVLLIITDVRGYDIVGGRRGGRGRGGRGKLTSGSGRSSSELLGLGLLTLVVGHSARDDGEEGEVAVRLHCGCGWLVGKEKEGLVHLGSLRRDLRRSLLEQGERVNESLKRRDEPFKALA